MLWRTSTGDKIKVNNHKIILISHKKNIRKHSLPLMWKYWEILADISGVAACL